MSNWVENNIQDIQYRLGDEGGGKYPPAYILRTMNRLYDRLNRETKCLEKQFNVDAGDLSDTVDYVDIPSDMIMPFRVEPELNYKEPGNFVRDGDESSNEEDTFTIANGQIIFSDASDDDAYEFWYKSSGFELTDSDSPTSTQVNEPEWPWEDLWQILFYGVCIELSKNYEMYEMDIVTYRELYNKLLSAITVKQGITPNIIGGYGVPTNRETNDYEWDR